MTHAALTSVLEIGKDPVVPSLFSVFPQHPRSPQIQDLDGRGWGNGQAKLLFG